MTPEVRENVIRLAVFLAVLGAMAAWELLAPRRSPRLAKPRRWGNNLALAAMNAILARIVVPVTAAGVAMLAQANGWGLLQFVALPYWLSILLAVLAFDLAIFFQHVLFHAVPILWRLHLVHHADVDFDVTTGLRFHTLEILLSALIKLGVVLVVGPPALAVVAFEVLLNASSMFNHGNVRIPARCDRLLRWLIVTPDMHRVHHSTNAREMNSNFGFNFAWWDYLLGTYRAQPAEGHETMTIGVPEVRDEKQVNSLPGMLLLPFAHGASATSPHETVNSRA